MKKTNFAVHKLAVHEIKDAVDRIALQHPGGESFFDELDEYIKHIASDAVYESLFSKADSKVLILTGGFGQVVADRIDAGTLPKYQYILFKGGLRKGNSPEIIRDHFSTKPGKVEAVFIDDTIYGGLTYRLIREYLHTEYQWRNHVHVERVVVVYDGCPEKRDNIESVFRYYDFYSPKPNFDFDNQNEGIIIRDGN